MAHLAQTYVHLRPYELNAETIQRLGAAIQESAEFAALEFYRGGVTIDVDLEEGSAKFWITVLGALEIAHMAYGTIADYKGFKESIGEMVQDARSFGDFMIEATKQQSKATDKQVFRTERRLQTPGKIKRVTEKLEKLQGAGLNAKQMNEQLEAAIHDIQQIEKDLTEEEQKGFHTLMLHFENLPPLKPAPPAQQEITPSPVAIRPYLESVSPSRALVSGVALPLRDVPFRLTESGARKEPLALRSSKYVPPIDDDGGPEKGNDIQPITS
ncbi:hypothetical protein [Bradyrhizobium sp. CCBAU 25338]|uniref:hypothetical protein n=1 Tax=Bradyrhizobium sp. CCBAU 25338 TaxID=1641877 RepID=UPI0023030B48|nr:hypothetical protein [Bradyrhizobium sp. CCBAU 25338]MDA9533148.1 hypothetical protein [Bradyrhizobium sp. CCBAU 25338]